MLFKFTDQAVGDQTLMLYWRVAIRLRDHLKKLPRLEAPKAEVTLRGIKNSGPAADISEHARAATSGTVTFTLQTLPEEQLEVLALRFRPFFAQGEKVNYLAMLALLGRCNEHLRPRLKALRGFWESAAFWQTMKLTGHTLPVDAENVITTAFYSKYFHVEPEKQQRADLYRKSLGDDLFEVALVSSVWQRSRMVVDLLPNIERHLLNQGLLSAEEASRTPAPERQFVQVTREFGAGAMTVLAPEEVGMGLPVSLSLLP